MYFEVHQTLSLICEKCTKVRRTAGAHHPRRSHIPIALRRLTYRLPTTMVGSVVSAGISDAALPDEVRASAAEKCTPVLSISLDSFSEKLAIARAPLELALRHTSPTRPYKNPISSQNSSAAHFRLSLQNFTVRHTRPVPTMGESLDDSSSALGGITIVYSPFGFIASWSFQGLSASSKQLGRRPFLRYNHAIPWCLFS